ncbi:MAG: hypothetical protein ACLPX1_00090 [Steroidobacteraceae bacterium]
MTRLASTIGLLTALGILSLEHAAAATAKPGAPGIDDPFAYCAHIGTVDTPGGGASPVPLALTPLLRKTLGLSAEAPLTPASYYWRCMDGAVYVCAVGANERCDSKADRTKQNTGADSYCRENPNAAFVPAFATGHNTIYEWSCSRGRALAGNRTAKLDHRGYRAEIWYRLNRQKSAP